MNYEEKRAKLIFSTQPVLFSTTTALDAACLRRSSALAPVNGPYGSALFASTPRVQLDAAGLVRSRSPVSLQARCSLAAVWGGESYDCTLFLEALPPARPSSLTWNGSMASLEGSWEWLVAETHTLAAGALTASGAGGTPLVGMSFAVRRRGSRLSAVFAASLGGEYALRQATRYVVRTSRSLAAVPCSAQPD